MTDSTPPAALRPTTPLPGGVVGRTLKAVSWNVEQGRNALEAAAWVRAEAPDILCQQEVQPGQISRLATALGMDPYPAPATHRVPTNLNVIFVRPDSPLTVEDVYEQDWAPWHAPANIAVKYRDADGSLSPRQLSVVGAHLCYWSPEVRLVEAQWFQTLAKPGWLTLAMGDWNSYRVGDGPTPAQWARYTDHAFRANRAYLLNGALHSDDRPDRQLLEAGYVEMARHAAQQFGQPGAMRPASGYRRYPGRPPGSAYNVDRGYLTAELQFALRGFEIRDTAHLRRISDHLPGIAVFDADTLRTILHTPAAVYQAPDDRGRRLK